MPDDKAQAKDKDKPAMPEAPKQSMFTRKGIVVLIVLMAVEGVALWAGMKFLTGKTNRPAKVDSTGIAKVQTKIGAFTIPLPPRSPEEITKELSFTVYFTTMLDDSAETKLLGKVDDNVKRQMKDQIFREVLKIHEDNGRFSSTKDMDTLEQRIKTIINEDLILLMREVLNEEPKGDLVKDVLLEDYTP